MFAIVEIAGLQVKVSPGDKVWVPFMSSKEEGSKLNFEDVYLFSDDKETIVGNPKIDGVTIEATLLEHTKGPKLIVFKKKRRTGYHKKQGHRQKYSILQIDEILVS